MTRRRWLIAILRAADQVDLILPWSRGLDRARRKAAARARLRAD